MSLNTAALEVLIAKGLSANDILEVSRALDNKVDRTATERKRRQRARDNAGDKSRRDVTRDPPPNEYISNPPPEPLDTANAVSPPSDFSDSGNQNLKPEHVVEAWNDMAERAGLPKAKMTPERQRKLRSRIRLHPVEDWTEAIAAFERSSFLRGENDRSWRPNFDFLLQPSSFTKLIEGAYDRPTH